MSDNMRIYSQVRKVPENAIKPIKGGAYGAAGLSDINAQWRIEKMTELYGPIGDGWIWEPVSYWVEFGSLHGQICVKYKMESGEWSNPIYGYGGTKIGGRDDSDIYKSTNTDALGNALKNLGIGADVWYNQDNPTDKNQFDGKYSAPPEIDEKRGQYIGKSKYPHAQKEPTQPAQSAAETKKLAQQPPKPAEQPQAKHMAAEGQKIFIIENLDAPSLDRLVAKYGPDLDGFSYEDAQKTIAVIQKRGAANG